MLLRSGRKVLPSQLKATIDNVMFGSNIKSKYKNICFGTLMLRNISTSKFCATDLIKVTFISNNKKFTVTAKTGSTLLDVVRNYNLNFNNFGLCEGCVACSTCHVIMKPEDFRNLSKMSDDEEDVLALADGVTDFSRLGCQIQLTKTMDGIEVVVPDHRTDVREDVPENRDEKS